eukprot:2373948-Pleurochrysis_carterae.AAC.1
MHAAVPRQVAAAAAIGRCVRCAAARRAQPRAEGMHAAVPRQVAASAAIGCCVRCAAALRAQPRAK